MKKEFIGKTLFRSGKNFRIKTQGQHIRVQEQEIKSLRDVLEQVQEQAQVFASIALAIIDKNGCKVSVPTRLLEFYTEKGDGRFIITTDPDGDDTVIKIVDAKGKVVRSQHTTSPSGLIVPPGSQV